jgi:RNA polymerase sigma-70 factor (ECF subfamily)
VQRSSERILDEYLVSAALVGDAGAWRRLVIRWQPRLLSHAWRVLGEAETAKDVVQEAWVEIFRGLARLDDLAAFPAWAFQIVTRRCQRQFRGGARDRRLAEAMEPESESVSSASEDHEFAVDMHQVRAALQALPAPQRSALALFYLESLSVAEIAVALDVPPGTVKTRLMHARRKVRALLEGVGNEQGG